jgi:hypothetical protein
MKTVSIRTRLTFWYAVLVACVVMLLGLGVFFGASWGLRKAADQELTRVLMVSTRIGVEAGYP